MARAGLHLTAESGSAMGWFPDVRTDIGDAQSLENDLSTFSGHMVNLRELLATAGPGSLVLIDEIAVGTDPEQGAALAQAVLEALAARGVTGIVTTHYERLKALGATDPRFANASVGFDLARLEPTFKLHLGTPGSSGALAVAQRMGIAPTSSSARASCSARTSPRSRSCSRRSPISSAGSRRSAPRCSPSSRRSRPIAHAHARASREDARSGSRSRRALAHGEALAALKAARREIDEVRRELRAQAAAEATAEDVKAATRRLVAPGAQVAQHEPKRHAAAGHARDARQARAGRAGDRAAARPRRGRRAARPTTRSRSASARCARPCRSARS